MNVNIWGPCAWQVLHATSFLLDSFYTKVDKSKADAKPIEDIQKRMFSSLAQLLPCRYCRESYAVFYMHLGQPKLGLCATWLHTLHSMVNKKLWKQKIEALPSKACGSEALLGLFSEPSFEVLQKRFLVGRNEPIDVQNVCTTLIAFTMGLQQNETPALLKSLLEFIEDLTKVLDLVPQTAQLKNLKAVLKLIMKQFNESNLTSEQLKEVLERFAYKDILKESPSFDAKSVTALIKAGACMKGSCF